MPFGRVCALTCRLRMAAVSGYAGRDTNRAQDGDGVNGTNSKYF